MARRLAKQRNTFTPLDYGWQEGRGVKFFTFRTFQPQFRMSSCIGLTSCKRGQGQCNEDTKIKKSDRNFLSGHHALLQNQMMFLYYARRKEHCNVEWDHWNTFGFKIGVSYSNNTLLWSCLCSGSALVWCRSSWKLKYKNLSDNNCRKKIRNA